MRTPLTTTLAVLSLIFLYGCSSESATPDGGSPPDGAALQGDGAPQDDAATADAASPDGAPADALATTDGTTTADDGGGGQDDGGSAHGLGAACSCTGAGCSQMGVPKPAGGTIVGCDDVPTTITGAALVCLRSYAGTLATQTYFANGYCGLMATQCTGASLICGSAVYGDYAALTSCPAGSVMISDSQAVDVFGQQATVTNKVCVKPCTGSGQCREGETDSVFGGAATQYQCLDKGGVKFCYDPRNLSASYTATAF